MVRRRLIALLLVAAAAVAVVVAGTGREESQAGSKTRPLVVATTTQLADFAREVAGDRARVTGLLGAGVDPHDYELKPSDFDAFGGAAVILRSGGEVDEWLDGALDSADPEAPVVTLATAPGVRPVAGDPHWWQDPRNAIAAVDAIRAALAQADPAGAPAYARNAAAYRDELRALDRAVEACINQVPPQQRKLVTTHDALAAYARRYGIEVVGAVIPSRSTRAQPSAGEVDELVETIRRERVRAVFAESSVAASVERAIAREAGAEVGEALYADTLGEPGSDGDTYAKSIAANTRALVAGFTGGSARCSLP